MKIHCFALPHRMKFEQDLYQPDITDFGKHSGNTIQKTDYVAQKIEVLDNYLDLISSY